MIKKILLFILPFIFAPFVSAATINVPLTSVETWNSCGGFQLWDGIGHDAQCYLWHVFQPDYSNIPVSSVTRAHVSWTYDPQETPINIRVADSYTVAPFSNPPLTPYPFVMNKVLSSDGGADINVSSVIAGHGIYMYGLDSGEGSVYIPLSSIRLTLTVPDESVTTYSVPLTSVNSWDTCAGFRGLAEIGHDQQCYVWHVFQPNYTGIPISSVTQARVIWPYNLMETPIHIRVADANTTAPFPDPPTLITPTVMNQVLNSDGESPVNLSILSSGNGIYLYGLDGGEGVVNMPLSELFMTVTVPNTTPTPIPTETPIPTPTVIPTPTPTAEPTPTPTPMPPQITALLPANLWVGLKNSDDVGIKFDLKAEVYKGTTLIGSGELDTVAGGNSGFSNANLDAIPLTLTAPVFIQSGDQLNTKLYVRNACTGSGHNSGTARLWYNDSVVNSQFGVTIDSTNQMYYLINNSLLGITNGSGPKQTVDIPAGAKCSAFKAFGTWSISL